MERPEAYIVDERGKASRPIPPAEALAAARNGNPVIVRGALQAAGLFDELRRATLQVFEEVASPAASAEVAERGFRQLHTVLTGQQIFAAESVAARRFTPMAHDLIAPILRRVFEHAGNFHSCGNIWVRFLTPQDFAAQHSALFSKRVGHLTQHNPHRDSFFTSPLNALNIWVAVGPVASGNSMLIYPGAAGEHISHSDYERRGAKIHPSQKVGRPINFALEPGDLLLFSGELLHSSEINITQDTRYVLTARFAIEPPDFPTGARWLVYQDDRFMNGPWSFLASLRSRLTPTYGRYLWQRRLLYWLKLLRQRLFGTPLSKPLPPERIEASDTAYAVKNGRLDLSRLGQDEIGAVNVDYCVARSETGAYAFSRVCPHRGADLACGYIEDGQIHCGWHNLPYELANGRQPCQSLGNLEVHVLDEIAPNIYGWPAELTEESVDA